jgi:hypothetical protein
MNSDHLYVCHMHKLILSTFKIRITPMDNIFTGVLKISNKVLWYPLARITYSDVPITQPAGVSERRIQCY